MNVREENKLLRGNELAQLPCINNAYLIIEDGKIAEYGEMREITNLKSEAKNQLEYWFERLEIQGWWNKKIQELSKGMAQKIQFVVTVLHRP